MKLFVGILILFVFILGIIFHASRDKKTLYRTMPCVACTMLGCYLTYYQDVRFWSICLAIIFIQIIMYYFDHDYKNLWISFAGASFIVFCFVMMMLSATTKYHDIVIDCPVTVSDGNVTISVGNIPDEFQTPTNDLTLDVIEFSKMPNGIYQKELVISYSCNYRKHSEGKCMCTNDTLCEICKEHINFNYALLNLK